MSKAINSRLEKLEAAADAAKGPRPWHRIVAASEEEAESKHAALIASGLISKDDNAIYRIITGVPRAPEGIAQ